MSSTTHRKHVRYQRLDRVRKDANRYVAQLEIEGARLGVPARVIRDLLKELGVLEFNDVRAAADVAGAGIIESSAATVDLTASSNQVDRASGSFITDGFANGDKILLFGTAGADGVYIAGTVAALTIGLAGATIPGDEVGVAAEIYRLAPAAREDPQPLVP